MERGRSIRVATFYITALLFIRNAEAWGSRGHQTIAEVGSQIVRTGGSFWSTNEIGMGTLTNVPDRYWKSGPDAENEKPNHFFQPDSFFSDPNDFKLFPRKYSDAVTEYTEPVVISAGTAPWRIKQFYDLAVQAFKNSDYERGLQIAGTMSHYIGDLSQPLHVSKNYDGQETNDPGIHKFFEATNIQSADPTKLSADIKKAAQSLLKDPSFLKDFKGNLIDTIFNEIDRAYAEKDTLIATDIKTHRDSKALLDIAKPRMADGAATLAIILGWLSADAGLGSNGATINVIIPAWIPPDFSDSVNASHSLDLDEDDCDQ